ncbi:hypothetical protein [Lacipirellula sp.]|uniref:hypothetical protein n=1 Tax=Lacipirellula sp. TaxID=2691419 RepID=UPI003D09B8D3
MNLKDRLIQAASDRIDPAAAAIARTLFEQYSEELLAAVDAEPLVRQRAFPFEHGADVFRELQQLLNGQGMGITQRDDGVIVNW